MAERRIQNVSALSPRSAETLMETPVHHDDGKRYGVVSQMNDKEYHALFGMEWSREHTTKLMESFTRHSGDWKLIAAESPKPATPEDCHAWYNKVSAALNASTSSIPPRKLLFDGLAATAAAATSSTDVSKEKEEVVHATPRLRPRQNASPPPPPSDDNAMDEDEGDDSSSSSSSEGSESDEDEKGVMPAGLTERQQLAWLLKQTSDADDTKEHNSNTSSSSTAAAAGGSTAATAATATGSLRVDTSTPTAPKHRGSTPKQKQQQQQQQQQTQPARKPARSRGGLQPRRVWQPSDYTSWSSEKKKAWNNLGNNPDTFYFNYTPPGVTPNDADTWSDLEIEEFKQMLVLHPPMDMWGLFSLNLYGRTGRQCQQLYQQLNKSGELKRTTISKKRRRSKAPPAPKEGTRPSPPRPIKSAAASTPKSGAAIASGKAPPPVTLSTEPTRRTTTTTTTKTSLPPPPPASTALPAPLTSAAVTTAPTTPQAVIAPPAPKPPKASRKRRLKEKKKTIAPPPAAAATATTTAATTTTKTPAASATAASSPVVVARKRARNNKKKVPTSGLDNLSRLAEEAARSPVLTELPTINVRETVMLQHRTPAAYMNLGGGSSSQPQPSLNIPPGTVLTPEDLNLRKRFAEQQERLRVHFLSQVEHIQQVYARSQTQPQPQCHSSLPFDSVCEKLGSINKNVQSSSSSSSFHRHTRPMSAQQLAVAVRSLQKQYDDTLADLLQHQKMELETAAAMYAYQMPRYY